MSQSRIAWIPVIRKIQYQKVMFIKMKMFHLEGYMGQC